MRNNIASLFPTVDKWLAQLEGVEVQMDTKQQTLEIQLSFCTFVRWLLCSYQRVKVEHSTFTRSTLKLQKFWYRPMATALKRRDSQKCYAIMNRITKDQIRRL